MKRLSKLGHTVAGRFTLGVLMAPMLLALCLARNAAAAPNQCTATSQHMLDSCRGGAQSDFSLALAKCDNLPTPGERQACGLQAQTDRTAGEELCVTNFDGRQAVCKDLGGAPYDPIIDPANFVAKIDNPFLPLKPGTTLIYEGMTDKGFEHIEFKVTRNTKVILGVTCVEVRDTVTLDGVLAEDTFDWFAQDKDGNVWYFGELSQEFQDGELVSLEGSWEAGVDGAKPGIVMKAHPQVGNVYRQEFALGVAEDMAKVVSLNASVTTPLRSFSKVLQTRDFSPLKAGADEYKFYARGIGQVRSVDIATGNHVDLIRIKTE